MEMSNSNSVGRTVKVPSRSLFEVGSGIVLAVVLALIAFHLSMLTTSAPLSESEEATLDRAIDYLQRRGFEKESFVLRHAVSYRSSDNWLNALVVKENAFAATNFPFQIVTLYPDFYYRLTDDTGRAMVLLHEAQHLLNKDEAEAYEYVWRNRERLGWTQASHGTTSPYITIEQQTRDHAPHLFTCPANLWNDCTETAR
jgi:hypothetical protein